MTAEEILDQLESEVEESDVDDPEEEEEDNNPWSEEEEEQRGEKEKGEKEKGEEQRGEKEKKKEKGEKDSTFIRDMGLDDEQEEEDFDFDCSFQDPDYQESREAHLLSSSSSEEELVLEEGFMSGKGKKRKKGRAASGGAGPGGSLARAGQAGGGVGGVAPAPICSHFENYQNCSTISASRASQLWDTTVFRTSLELTDSLWRNFRHPIKSARPFSMISFHMCSTPSLFVASSNSKCLKKIC